MSGLGQWWSKNVIEPIHGMAHSGRFTINNWYALQGVKLVYFSVPVVLGMGLMSMVNEGGMWHAGAKEAVLRNKQELIESHRRRLEEAKTKWGGAVIQSDTRMHTNEDQFKSELKEVLQDSRKSS